MPVYIKWKNWKSRAGWITGWGWEVSNIQNLCSSIWNVKHQTNIRQQKTTNVSLGRFKLARTHQFHRLCEAFWTCGDNNSVQVPESQIGEIMPPAGNQNAPISTLTKDNCPPDLCLHLVLVELSGQENLKAKFWFLREWFECSNQEGGSGVCYLVQKARARETREREQVLAKWQTGGSLCFHRVVPATSHGRDSTDHWMHERITD